MSFDCGFYWENGALHPFNAIMGEECEKVFKQKQFYILELVEMPSEKAITWQQTKAIHLWLGKVASTMVALGIDMRMVLNAQKKGFSVAPSKEMLKESLWRPLQKAVLGTRSTQDLTRVEVNEIYHRLDTFLQREFKIHIPFPDRYGQSLEAGAAVVTLDRVPGIVVTEKTGLKKPQRTEAIIKLID